MADAASSSPNFPQRTLESLWAPWRFEYFTADRADDFFAAAAQAADDAAHLVVARRKSVFLMMNRYPYAVGHLMAVPYRRVAELADLGEGEWREFRELTVVAQRVLAAAVAAQGFNIGFNIGGCAGAGVTDRLHLHIVPRWAGDTNFMPVLGGVRVQPEALASVYEKLRAAAAGLPPA